MPAEFPVCRRPSAHAGVRRPGLSASLVIGAIVLCLVGLAGCNASIGQTGGSNARIGAGEPFTFDPAAAGDSGSANVISQVFEGLTTFDADSNVQPALADAWQASDDGRRITFHLRPGIQYSDGSPITAQDVVDNWFRLIDPQSPSPLSSLLADVQGAADYQAGRLGRKAVGLRTSSDQVIVDLAQPATYFPSVTASPSLAVMPPSMFGQVGTDLPDNIVVSGGYVPSLPESGVIRLTANTHYWAGTPALGTVDLVTDFGGKNGVDLFGSGDLDYTSIGSGDASWSKYDGSLGPQLRQINSFSVSYYGFNTHTRPFDDPRVRLAFGESVDWNRIVTLGDGLPATSMVPLGVPGRDDADHRPAYNPSDAKSLLAQAGYGVGKTFPPVTISTYGVGYEQTVAAELEQNLGVTVNIDVHDFADFPGYITDSGNPQLWTLSWIADYPHPNDFLGLLLTSGSASNFGGWSDPDYDKLITQAAATADVTAQSAVYAQAQDILASQVPAVPVQYDQSWALSRTGLLGALESGVGFVRIAGLAWAPGSGR